MFPSCTSNGYFSSDYRSLPLSPIRRGHLKWVPIVGLGLSKRHIHTDEKSFLSRTPAFVPFLAERVSHKNTLNCPRIQLAHCWPMVPDKARTPEYFWWYNKLRFSKEHLARRLNS